jgi:glycosyltransferase involved in cell wall biosynthesis
MIAKNIYVESRSGWFSERSVCYLASGKPVLAQDTGFNKNYRSGDGILSFTDLDEAVAGANEIQSNWERHSRAARAIAEEYFDSRKVLTRLLAQLEVL